MQTGDPMENGEEARRIIANLLRTVELTDLCLHLRMAVLRGDSRDQVSFQMVMKEVRQAKERAWLQNQF
jgi:hypothetical protein